MAATTYGPNDPLAVKLWAKKLAVEVLKETWAAKFVGPSSSDLIQIKDETSKSAGDKVTYGLRMQLTGRGTIGDGTLEGNEESLVTYSDSVTINQLRHAVRSAGRMSQQRVPFSVREEALSGLTDWNVDRFDTSFFNQICGYTAQSDTAYTGLNAVTAPDSSHRNFRTGSADESQNSSSYAFVLGALDAAKEYTKTLSPAIRPVTTGGKKYYVAFLHPYQVTDMRISTTTGQWLDIQKAAMTGGMVEDNPIFDGALGVYNGIILHEDNRVTQGVNSSTGAAVTTVRRAVLCGAQAAMVAYGRENSPTKYNWVEELFDYQNELGVSAGSIWALKKTVFNSADFADVVMSTYAVAH